MKQTIEIEVPDGKKAVWKDGKVVFEDINSQLPETWEEFCRNHTKIQIGESIIAEDSDIHTYYSSSYRELTSKNILPSKKAAEQHRALMQLHQLRDCYRQGWVPDYLGESRKWYITKYYNRPVVSTTCNFSEFLSFQSKGIAQEFLDNFKDLIEQAGDLI